MKNPTDEPTDVPTPGARPVSRRGFLGAGIGGTGLLAAATLGFKRGPATDNGASALAATTYDPHHGMHPMPAVVGEVDHMKNGFNPTHMLTDFDGGKVSTLPDGRTLREY